MAMLAEPRRKQKWSVDPRNSAWSKDESKFGQKMLERMGWSKGKGLGKSEQGGTEHIKVKVKNNNLGLGTSANHEDNWIAHQDDFNQLLAELNSCHGQSTPPAPQDQSFSLEEKSKTSKKRVHYMKFTKGKDLSSRSQTDLACIFGKRAQRGTEQEQESSGQESQEEESGEVEAVTPDPEVEANINTVTSSLTMQEYFAQRMKQLRGRHAPVTSPETAHLSPSATPTDHAPDTPADHAPDTPTDHTSDTPVPRKTKPKKKKKKKDRAEEARVGGQSHEAEPQSCGDRSRKRKRADGGMERGDSGASCGSCHGGAVGPPDDPAVQPDRSLTGKRKRTEEEPKKKKKDKKKKKVNSASPSEK